MRYAKKWTPAVMAACFMVLSACGAAQQQKDAHDSHHATNGDLRQTTASIEQLPPFLDGQRVEIVTAYKLAARSASVLEYMPCYCGCGSEAGHLSNRDCFIQDIREDGSIVWDDHGSRCGICMEIAVVADRLSRQGESTKDIRALIEQRYASGFSEPTKTKLPDSGV